MRIYFEFDTHDYDLNPIQLARIMLDIQHLAIVAYGLAKDNLSESDIVFDEYKRKYKWLIEAPPDQLGDAELFLVRMSLENPFKIEIRTKELAQDVRKAFTRIFRYIINNMLFSDLEREKRSVEIQLIREQVLEKRLQTAASALNVAKKIPDKQLREEFIDSLRSSVWPFAMEHPPIKSVELIDDGKKEGANETEEELLDEVDDNSKLN